MMAKNPVDYALLLEKVYEGKEVNHACLLWLHDKP